MLRRGRLVLLSVAVGAATAIAAVPGQAGTLRTGLARAQLARVVPYVGIPSVGAGIGVAQAEVQGASAHASAGVADFGMMSMILGAVAAKAPVPLPELPGPITADDRDHPHVERNLLAPPAEVPAAPGAPAPAWEEAHASKAPASRARVRGPELGVPGVLTFTAGESTASADGGVTSSTVTVDRLVLGGSSGVPEVVLSGLVWTARQAMGEPGSASFTIGSVSVAGQALPIPAAASPADLLKPLNDGLAPLGLRLEVPVSTADAAGAAVSSLVIQVRNPEPVANLVGQVTQPAVPVLNQVLDALLAAAPDAAASRLVVNALLATGTSRGGGRLELGGATARIGNTEVADLTPPAPPELPAEPVSLPAAFTPSPAVTDPVPAPAPAPPSPVTDFAAGSGYGGSSSYESSLPVAPPAPSGAARSTDVPAAPDGSTVSARPVATTAPGGASAPLVLGAALLAIAVLALGDKLRLRRLAG
ncbi:MAG TPA: hypothetical protein VEG38_00775 [Acidimicrobiia bacterium]|nr:hypothetical protein [Acidimicrobiia bacterium]